MMANIQPPLLDEAPPLQCNRALRWEGTHVDQHCGRPATWHIIWTPDMENGLACDEHYEEAKAKWVFFAAHPYEMDCSMPTAKFYVDENVCRADDETLGLVESVAVELEISPA